MILVENPFLQIDFLHQAHAQASNTDQPVGAFTRSNQSGAITGINLDLNLGISNSNKEFLTGANGH